MTKGENVVNNWFLQKDWKLQDFQLEVRKEILAGKDGLLNAPTGSGKTLAIWSACIAHFIDQNPDYRKQYHHSLKYIWITPLRALTSEIADAMQNIATEVGLNWRIESRTGDTSSHLKSKQRKTPPDALVTTPESLHLLLSYPDYISYFQNLKFFIVDEWHELLGTKRGIQVELALSRLKAINQDMKVWGISATIANLEEAMLVLTGKTLSNEPVIVKAGERKDIKIETLLPDTIEKFPWAGHLGIKQLPAIINLIHAHKTTLIFTNTRSQAEIWYQQLLLMSPELAGQIALHHGSLNKDERNWVEAALDKGILKAVICTSTLDLGVDFKPVEAVIQIGGPKGVARFLQRAGRSGHRPGEKAKIWFAPTNSLEILEGAALKDAFKLNAIEQRKPLTLSYDVLIQYLITLACSEGFSAPVIYKEIKSTHCYAALKKSSWNQVLTFITTGGDSLAAYKEFRKAEKKGRTYMVTDRKTIQKHRLSIGTIVSDPVISVKFRNGKSLGTIEENFIDKLQIGSVFWFSGRNLQLIRTNPGEVIVKPAGSKKGIVPQWMGGRMPLSSQLSDILRLKFQELDESIPEIKKLLPLLELQKSRSVIPKKNQLLLESYQSKEGYHLFAFPFQGRHVNEALAWLAANRISTISPRTFSIAVNDYGFELLSDQVVEPDLATARNIFSPDGLFEDLNISMNFGEMAKRRFREIATISGLIFQGYPGKPGGNKYLQSSSGLIFDVFSTYDPGNILLQQAYDEVLNLNLDKTRLEKALKEINKHKIIITKPERFSPFAFPLMAERLRETLSYEKWEDRISRLAMSLEEKG